MSLPAGTHLSIARTAGGRFLSAQLSTLPTGMQFCPSVDVLFTSVAALCQGRAVGVLSHRMGDDGADGMVQICGRRAAYTIAESEESAVVFGMPRESDCAWRGQSYRSQLADRHAHPTRPAKAEPRCNEDKGTPYVLRAATPLPAQQDDDNRRRALDECAPTDDVAS